MTRYININGADIDKDFLNENIEDAKSYKWILEPVPFENSHVHCIICGVPIESGYNALKSNGGWLCNYCYEHFINRK
ncbi:MAG: hypothetical protein PF692_07825 [Kiritimatiellae bacterium]|jgi:hypothetical protein|nr:hypothetical protein [Kiritimatiellia bacterium]